MYVPIFEFLFTYIDKKRIFKQFVIFTCLVYNIFFLFFLSYISSPQTLWLGSQAGRRGELGRKSGAQAYEYGERSSQPLEWPNSK